MITIVNKPETTFLPLEIKGKKVIMRWNPEKVSDGLIKCSEDSLFISHNMTYNLIVTNLIRFRYSLDEELAIVNNYQWNQDLYKDEYTEFLKWRATCKDAAKEYLATKLENTGV